MSSDDEHRSQLPATDAGFDADNPFSAPPTAPLSPAKVCCLCGDPGYQELLLTCFNCRSVSIHAYCTFPIQFGVPNDWICEDCLPPSNYEMPCEVVVESSKERMVNSTNVDLPATNSSYDHFQEPQQPLCIHTKKKSKKKHASQKAMNLGKKTCNPHDGQGHSLSLAPKPSFKKKKMKKRSHGQDDDSEKNGDDIEIDINCGGSSSLLDLDDDDSLNLEDDNLPLNLDDCMSLSPRHEDNAEDNVVGDDIAQEDLYLSEADDLHAPGINSASTIDGDHVADPFVGMTFASEHEVLNYCYVYGNAKGFGIKIRSSEKVVDEVGENIQQPLHLHKYKRLRLVCSKSGKFQSRSKNPSRGPKTSITACPFKINGSLQSDRVWKLTHVVLEHNHSCIPERSRFFPNYRFVSRQRILDNDRAGVPIAKTYSAFVVQYGGHDKVPFDDRDCRNLISKSRRLHLKDGDFVAMRSYFDEMSSSNSNFFYMYDMNEDGRLRNVFWADGRSRAAFKEFGDILSFDTTYVSNRYKMPFAPFVGVDHHGQSVLFGCALLCGEEIGNFVWLFNAWLKCMGGKAPQGILTDQCKSIGNAVAQVFPETRHRWCIWHIMQNAKKHLEKNPSWKKIRRELQDCLHDSLSIAEFEHSWKDMIASYELETNRWCIDMYSQRSRWVPIYFKDDFWAGMSSTQRSEGMNFFKGFVNLNTTLKQFVEQYGFALAKRVSEEEKSTFNSLHSPIQCMTEHIFELVYHKLYTSSKFKEFQDEVRDMAYNTTSKLHEDADSRLYEVLVRKLINGSITRCTFMVKVDRITLHMKCDCKNFEYRGILCSHVLCVFHEEELDYVPERYILSRWRKDVIREYLKVPVPYYTLLKKKPEEVQRYEKMTVSFQEISGLAMTNEGFFNEFMGVLKDFIVKATEIRRDNGGLTSQCLENIGKVYGRRAGRQVKDPLDRRVKGRAPTKRKGYKNVNK